MKQDDYDLLSQYIDGELASEQQSEVKRRLLSDPEFNALHQQLKTLSDNVKNVIPDFKDEPVRDELAQLLETKKPQPVTELNSWKRALPIAASLAFVCVLGYLLVSQPFNNNGMTLSESMLSQVADDENWLSDNGTEVVVVQSYLGSEQTLCREYYARKAEDVEHGLSCYDNGQWQKQVFAIKGNDSEAYYVTASSEFNGVEQFIESKGLEPLTENQANEVLATLDK